MNEWADDDASSCEGPVPVGRARSGASFVGAAVVVWFVAVGASGALPFPRSDPWEWLTTTRSDTVVMTAVRAVAMVAAVHAVVVFGLTLAVALAQGGAGSGRGSRVGLLATRTAVRLAGPIWRRTVAALLGVSMSVPLPFAGGALVHGATASAAEAGAAADSGHGGPQRWPDLSDREAPGRAAAPVLVRLSGPSTSSSAPGAPSLVQSSLLQPSVAPSTVPKSTRPPAASTALARATSSSIGADPTRVVRPADGFSGADVAAAGALGPAAVRRDVAAGEPAASGVTGQWRVRPGEHFWSIAAEVVSRSSATPFDERAVAAYWVRLIEANRSRLRDPGNPDLLMPGTVLVLPSPHL